MPTDTRPTVAEAARVLHALGAHVIPIARIAGDAAASKRPTVSQWRQYQERQPTTEEIEAWFGASGPRNLAVIGGAASGLVIVDTDSQEAEAWGAASLPPTPWTVRTAKGFHRYYLHPGADTVIGNRAHATVDGRQLALDLRGDGGYVVGPWSIHGSGAVYAPTRWPWTRDDIPTVPTYDPAWFDPPVPIIPTILDDIPAPAPLPASPPSDIDWRTAFARANDALLTRFTLPVARGAGERGECPVCHHKGCFARSAEDPTRWSCFSAQHPTGYGAQDATGVCHYGDLVDLALYEDTGRWPDAPARVEHLRAAGLLAPHLRASTPVERTGAPALASLVAPPTAGDISYGTDLWFARMIAARYGEDIRYVATWGDWIVWDGLRWRRDETGAVERLVHEILPSITATREALRKTIDVEYARGDHDAAARAKVMLDQVGHAAKKYAGNAAIQAAIRRLQVLDGIAIHHDRLDAHPLLLNVRNGTLDLAGHEPVLRDPARSDLLTMAATAAYDPQADTTLWDRFLARVQPDASDREYLQRWAGSCLMGQIREQLAHVFYGEGANGKSVFTGALHHVLGEYALAPSSEFLVVGERHPTEIAALHGRRLVVCGETEEGARLNVARIKSLTGGDVISARRMREDYWELKPCCHLCLHTNHEPRINDAGWAIWRRMRMVRWPVRIPPAEQDGDLQRKLEDHSASVLRWVVEGYTAYIREGLAASAGILASTEEYRVDEDSVGEFLRGWIQEADGEVVLAADIWKHYLKWANRLEIPEKTRVGQRTLTKRIRQYFGCFGVRYFTSPARGFAGLTLKEGV